MAPVGSQREFDQDFNPYAAPEIETYSGEQQDFEKGELKLAGFWERFLALFIDWIILHALSTALAIAFGIMIAMTSPDPRDPTASVILIVVGVLVIWFYEAGMTASSYQGTVGKLAMGIKVTDLEGRRIGFLRATVRILARFLSALILMIGYFIQPFTEKKQALHDMLAGTLVVNSR